MTNAEQILNRLEQRLTNRVEPTLYGRAALVLGFPDAPEEYAYSQDVGIVLWTGQDEELERSSNFWDALEATNQDLADTGRYMTHLFEEDQVVLSPTWKENRVRLLGSWRQLLLYRLSDMDLLLSKLMRDDPIDHADALFLAKKANLGCSEVQRALEQARIPAIPEIEEQFALASRRLLERLNAEPSAP